MARRLDYLSTINAALPHGGTMRTGAKVKYVVDGAVGFRGTVAYVTPDGWVGIRDAAGRVDEAPGHLVVSDS